ncbi:FAD-binding oxidoreductase [Saccharospirillum salsuginis]|uniref:Uncharacterized protein n=1 Tax=Saccharospirillum salsuginis TaxID=418750 RepID=A0A918NJ55_9GAMM|nr:FAD-binding oxidoreductase [Saccharospirillum salsuginis]GGX74235.1 hypothetical protein GCM10007392_47010 [Saccharospirillum salsuginis]
MKLGFWSAVWVTLLIGSVEADTLKPFTTDGCSAFPDGTPRQQSLWLDCCIQHDLAYWMGGTYDERLSADRELRACVADIGEPEIAELMLAGVRVGGSPYFPTFYRWGYGWSYLRGYEPLTDSELDQVRQRLRDMRRVIDRLEEHLAR